MNPTAVVTIVSNNYLHFARTLMKSVAQHHPDAQRYCVIVDRDMRHASALDNEFEPLELGQLGLPDGDDFLFQYTVLELNTAVKPWALQHLIEKGHTKVLYIDPDILLYRPLTEVLLPLDGDSDIVFTPHLLSPMTDKHYPSELDIRRAGTYNLGFCALRASPNALSFLSWWQGKLHRECIVAPDKGIFVDQSWMDLVPGLFPNVHILRHPGFNVAYWNLFQRPLTRDGKSVLANDQELAFFHFSGLDPLSPEKVSKHQNRLTIYTISDVAAEVIKDYCGQVIANGLKQYQVLPYGFNYFDDGTPISVADRSRYRSNDELRAMANGQPFKSRRLVQIEASSTPAPLQVSVDSEPFLEEIYAFFLDRLPDTSAYKEYKLRFHDAKSHRRLLLAVATSPEARTKPGWIQRLISWYTQGSHFPKPPVDAIAQRAAEKPQRELRPSPYGGLGALEADSAEAGIWVGPRLDLPVPPCSKGHIVIRGSVDLRLLRKGGAAYGQRLRIHGPKGLLHTEKIDKNGKFEVDIDIDPSEFAGGSQWVILAGSHTVPKDIGMNNDTRQLAWRVQHISVDDQVLVDSTRSPATAPMEVLYQASGINLIGYLSAELGLGEAVRSLASACAAKDVAFSAIDVGYQSGHMQRDNRIVRQAVSRHFPIDVMYVNADQTATTTAYLDRNNHRGRYRIGFWHWEQPRILDSAIASFAHVDEVWVPSTFVYEAVSPFSPVPVVKIPHALEITLSPGLNRSQFGLPNDKVLALVMYDLYSYQYRKNPQAAVEAFKLAARHHGEATLVIKTTNSEHHPQARAELMASVADLPNVIFIDDFLTRQQTWDLQSCCDILISLHRAEGFGLVPAEMMYLEKPVVATGWSANMDFMTAENSFPVRYQLKPLEHGVGPYAAGLNWAEADIDHAADCIARLIESPELRQRIGRQASHDIRRQLSPQAVGALVQERLSLLGFWHPELRP